MEYEINLTKVKFLPSLIMFTVNCSRASSGTGFIRHHYCWAVCLTSKAWHDSGLEIHLLRCQTRRLVNYLSLSDIGSRILSSTAHVYVYIQQFHFDLPDGTQNFGTALIRLINVGASLHIINDRIILITSPLNL